MGKDERLKSRKLIDRVFREGKSFALFPFRVYYAPLPLPGRRNPATPEAAATTPATATVADAAGIPTLAAAAPETTATGASTTAAAPRLQAGFGASSRNFKKAVDRNRIKRLTREAYRLQKQPLQEWLKEKDRSLALFFIYTGKGLPDYEVVKDKIGLVLQKLMKEPGS